MSKFISPLWKTELGLHHHFEMFDVSRLSHGKVCYCGIIYPEKVLLLDNAIISTKQYCKITCRPDTLEQKYCSNSNASIPYRKYHLVIICPIAIAYSMGQIIKSFCVCACVCVCVCPSVDTHTVAFLRRFSPNWTQTCKPPKVRTSSLGVNIAPPLPLFPPKNPHFGA